MSLYELNEQGDKPDNGFFGSYGGRYAPETLIAALDEIENTFNKCWNDDKFRNEFSNLLSEYAGRPSPLTYCNNLSDFTGYKVFLKREDLNHTGSHKINNVLGQALLAREMGKTHLIAETGAGQHGVATATAAALFGMECTVYMGAVDVARQELNVFRMELLGAKVIPVTSGSATLKDAVNDAMRAWVSRVDDSHYCLGSVMGPHPFPYMVREFQSVVGNESKEQFREINGNEPDAIVACVGGGSNAIGSFKAFENTNAKLIGIEPAGEGLTTDKHGAAVEKGKDGMLHGMKTLVLQDEDGQIQEAHSISAGLDYPGVGPEHAYLFSTGRASYLSATDDDALYGFAAASALEGIIPALESAHAIGWLIRNSRDVINEGQSVIVTMSGRGDKDVYTINKSYKDKVIDYVEQILKARNS
ncbi:MAG: tryptophan synthase subunit beta [Acidimicrobiia bacterium]